MDAPELRLVTKLSEAVRGVGFLEPDIPHLSSSVMVKGRSTRDLLVGTGLHAHRLFQFPPGVQQGDSSEAATDRIHQRPQGNPQTTRSTRAIRDSSEKLKKQRACGKSAGR